MRRAGELSECLLIGPERALLDVTHGEGTQVNPAEVLREPEILPDPVAVFWATPGVRALDAAFHLQRLGALLEVEQKRPRYRNATEPDEP